MPKVPTSNVIPMQPKTEMPSETMLAMAASMMHSEGRLLPQSKASDDRRK